MTQAQHTLATELADIWREILARDDVSPSENFFELGGDSLAAVRMLAEVAERLQTLIEFPEFLEAPTLAELTAAALAAGATLNAPAPAGDADIAGEFPASFAQQRLLFLEELAGPSAAYNMPIGFRIPGPLDGDALARALAELTARHAALRTTFAVRDGQPIQRVAPIAAVVLERNDLSTLSDPESEARRRVDELAATPIALDRAPLMRAALLRVADDEHVLALVFHHLICDGWSHVVIMRELGALYRAYADGEMPELAPPRSQAATHAAQERERLTGTALEAAVAPWVSRLEGAPGALDLPTDRPRPAALSDRGHTYRLALPDATAQALRDFARRSATTPFATLLAAYYALLYRYSGQDDIVIGATTSGRDRPELDDGVGLFASTVALRGDLAGSPSFAELATRTRDTVLWALAHQEAPFEEVVSRLALPRDLSRHPLFSVFVAHVPRVPAPLAGAVPFDARPATSRFDLTLFFEEEAGDAFELAWEYSSDLFDAATIEGFARHYLRLLQAGLDTPELAIDELPLLDESGLRAAVAAGAPQREDYPVALMHERFEAHAAATPGAVAVTLGGDSLTYAELNARANRVAHRLRELGAGHETLIALLLAPSLELVVAILGVLKAGGAYVPLDPAYPSERIAFALSDTGAPLLISTDALRDRIPAGAATVVALDGDRAELARQPDHNPEPLGGPDSLAYVIYTSGSTGQPKGVLVEHRQVARLFTATDAWYGFGPQDVWILLHSYAFDFSVWELWGALAYGGRLVISPLATTRSPKDLAELLAAEGVTVLNATPSLFVTAQEELLAVAGRLALRYVVFGGEALAPSSLRPWYEHFGETGAQLVNMYGITETTVHVTYRPLGAQDAGASASPIGAPIPDLGLYLLDPARRPVPTGVAGELYVGGAGLARGYLNRPELNAQRFIENPFGPGRLYRTGDLARRLPDGELDFRGRIDEQVKIRGFRIELGEIRAAIREVGGVADAAVVAVPTPAGDTQLAAYVVAREGAAAGAGDQLLAAIAAHLQDKLPSFMVPSCTMLLERIPLTRNGKTDTRALPAPVWEQAQEDDFSEPSTPTELEIAEVWQSVLGLDRVGLADNFFNLGGHSLLAARVVTMVRRRLAVELSVTALFQEPTLGGFARAVAALRSEPAGPEAQAEAEPGAPGAVPSSPGAAASEPAPLSFTQRQLLYLDHLSPGASVYNAALAMRVWGELRPELLRSALHGVYARHEALRTVLEWDATAPRQTVLEHWSTELPLVDLSGLPDAEREAALAREMKAAGLAPFDLSRDLMLRATLYRLHEHEHVILFQPHHIAFDAWAVEVLYRDLTELYNAALEDRPPSLPELTLQYRDFARWQHAQLQGGALERDLEFWRTHLAGAPTLLHLPTDRPRPAAQSFEGATHRITLGAESAAALGEVCREQQVTPYMLLLAVFGTVLYRWSGQDDILLGGPMANRDHAGFEHLIGFFANTVLTRTRLRGNPTFGELLARVKTSVLTSIEHQHTPFELVVDAVRPERDPSANPLFQVNFRVRVGAPPTLGLDGTRSEATAVDLGIARFDLALELHVAQEQITAEFNYSSALFDATTIEALAQTFTATLAGALADPDRHLLSFDAPEAIEATRAAVRPAAGIRGFRAGR